MVDSTNKATRQLKTPIKIKTSSLKPISSLNKKIQKNLLKWAKETDQIQNFDENALVYCPVKKIEKDIMLSKFFTKVYTEKNQEEESFTPKLVDTTIFTDSLLASILTTNFRIRSEQYYSKVKRYASLIPHHLAPFKLAFCFVDISRRYDFTTLSELQEICKKHNVSSLYEDLAGKTIPWRYIRYDEIGIPYVCTITTHHGAASELVIRSRDTMEFMKVDKYIFEEFIIELAAGRDWSNFFQKHFVKSDDHLTAYLPAGGLKGRIMQKSMGIGMALRPDFTNYDN